MSRFILIEPSLSRLGGHYFEYSKEVLQAAEQAGFEPILAINQNFPRPDLFPARWQVHRCFPHSSGRIHRIPNRCIHKPTTEAPSQSLGGMLQRWWDFAADRFKTAISDVRYLRRWSRTNGFANACRSLFEQVGFQPGDQVLCSTIADMDLLGLVSFLESTEASREADWHLQFHFSIYYGRDPEYGGQADKITRLKQRFQRALQRVSDHRLFFYTTTAQLTRQFNSLAAAEFQTLNWAVGRKFQQPDHRDESFQGLRLFCPGGIRREKGADQIRTLIADLDQDWLRPGRAQLLFQSDRKRRAETILDLPAGTVARFDGTDVAELPGDPVVALPFPLDTEQYASAIRAADIGVLLYNSDEYFARCSGILLELLTAGVPVIVPGGCWLADQIQQVNNDYLLGVQTQMEPSLRWNQRGLEVSAKPAIVDLPRPNHLKNMLITVDRWGAGEYGSYLRLELQQRGANGQPLARLAHVVSCSPELSQPAALFHVDPRADRLQLSLCNPYGNQRLPKMDLKVDWFAGQELPMGKVGLATAKSRHVPQLIEDVLTHHEHYRQAAQQFARQMIQRHDPSQTIQFITNRAA